jgi:SpoVK/Ycf46/Vps4 family AAA+-type ATPase
VSESRGNALEEQDTKDEAENAPTEGQRENTSTSSREVLDEDNGNVRIGDGKNGTIEEEEEGVSLRTQELGLDPPSNEDGVTEDPNQQVDVENWAMSQRRQARSGSGRVRPNRSRKPEGLPPVVLPEWFFSKNVKCAGEDASAGSLAVYPGKSASEGTPKALQTEGILEDDVPAIQNAKYTIHIDIYREILSAIKAGLILRPPRNIPMNSIPRPLTHLQCPKDGGTFYLDAVVETIAEKLGADVVRLDGDDIAQLIGTYVDENLAWSWSKTALLGYDAQKAAGKLEDYEKDLNTTEEDLDADDNPISRFLPMLSQASRPRNKKLPFVISGSNSPLAALLNPRRPGESQPRTATENLPEFKMFTLQGDSNSQQMKSAADQWLDLKVATVLDALICAADAKRAASPVASNDSDKNAQPALSTPRGVIVQVRDFKEINVSPYGAELLDKLRAAINKRWFDGRAMILIGTSSSEEGEPALSKPEIQILQSDVIDGDKRTIFVPPDRRQEQDAVFESDEKARIRSINIRHIEDMITKLAGGNLDPTLTVDIEDSLDNATAFTSDLDDCVWAYPRVHRLATTILGLNTSVKKIDGLVFTEAWKLLEASDKAKFDWGAAELKEEDDEVELMLQDSKDTTKDLQDKIKKIRSECTSHEKRLLGGLITPSDIHTTFSNVRAPKETVEALKTLTSLSLIRPEAFSYGVLATDKIPGLLLYGPPGTGKTLLAKAVAKESGATVLEVSGAEVSDMYVGEGEKNVKAIFSLAKKLSPCVVFIDEADSLLGSRSSEGSKRATHREIINQFLREWDGLKDLSAFIMVATNRPFDLDDAVLRRLPRRLLVDLPVEKDREAILKIHLKDEILDESVSLAALAKDTPFYSGSDLKNVSVAAAMACIREENEVAAQRTGEVPYEYPPKRILMKHHFDKAMDEISASISDDMSTLNAIRKFDEKYGDRKGRRKKASSLGFGGTTVPEKDSEAARVRKLQA